MPTLPPARRSPRFVFGAASLLLALLLIVGRPPAALAAGANLSLTLATAFPIVNSGAWSVVNLSYSCSSVTTTPCENATVTAVLPPELAGGIGDVQAFGAGTTASYNPATRTITWAFNSAIVVGAAGTLELRVRFPAGSTPDGATATLRAEMRSTTAPPKLSNPLTITARARASATADKSFVSGGAPDVPTTYSLRVCLPSNSVGVLDLSNVLITDTLPLGATFLSASHGGTASGGVVTWAPTSLSVAGGTCATRTVTVRFPSASFNVGTQLRNDLTVSAQAGSTTLLLGDSDVRLLQPTMPGYGFAKSGPSSALTGEVITYTLGISNTGTSPLDGVVVTDTVPAELDVTRIGAGGHNLTTTVRLAVEYTTNLTPTFTAAPGSPVTGAACYNIAPNTGGGCSTITLAGGARVTAVRWRYLDPLPFGFVADDHRLSARVTGTPVNAIIVNRATGSYSYNGVTASRPAEARTRVSEPGSRATVGKLVSPPVIYAGGTLTYTVSLTNTAVGGSTAAIASPVLADLLVDSLSYVPGSTVVLAKPAGAPDPVVETVANYRGTGRTLLRWRWDGYSLPAGEAFTLRFLATVKPSTLAGTLDNTAALASFANPAGEIFIDACDNRNADSNDLDGDGITSEQLCGSTISSAALARAANTDSLKLVLGQLDSVWTRDPLTGKTTPGGMADYQVVITNTNTIPLTGLVLIDILPWAGDVGVVRYDQPRGTQWRPYLIGPISAPAGATVYYSTSTNPCRNPELGLVDGNGAAVDAPGCELPGWSAVPPADITTVGAVKIDFGALVLQPQDSVLVTWPMRAPLGGTPGEIAWNTFGYRARDLNGNYLPAAEPARVGIERTEIKPPAYGDYVWLDADLDGVRQDGEPGVNGARIDFYEDTDATPGPSAGDRFVAFTVSGPDNGGNPGFYLFSDPDAIPPGTYYTIVTPPPGYGLTTLDVGADDRDSDVNPATRATVPTRLDAGEIDLSWDVGLITDTAVGNYVWIDRNANGVQDEPASDGVNGVTVRLYDAADGATPIATTVTGDDHFGQPGYYIFAGLSAGNYIVEFVLPSGFAFTAPLAGADALDSDAGAGGRTATFSLAEKQLDLSRDAGLTLAAGGLALGDRVWLDQDNDGVYEPLAGERGIDGVSLSLYRDFDGDDLPDPGEYVAGTTTRTVFSAPGYYQFAGLSAGSYLVVVDGANFVAGAPLAGLRSSSGNSPAPDPDNDRDHDDNGDLLGGNVRTLPITLSAGGEPGGDGDGTSGNQTLDLGFIGGAALGDRVWLDSNGDGLQTTGEPGVAAVTVELLDGTGAAVLATTTTDASGRYGFTGLAAGAYRVRFGVPLGHTLTITGAGALAADSDPDPVTRTTPAITLADGQSDLTWDAGLVAPPASLGDLVWDDQDRDGVQDAGEPGVAGVTVSLYTPGPDGAAGGGDDTFVVSATTTLGGGYSFGGLAPGAYYVLFGAPPAGYTVSLYDRGGDDARDSDADPGTLRTAVTTLSPGESDPSWDLGLYAYASLGDRVWKDLNNNGLQDGGEPGVANVTVRLYRSGSSVAIASTTTDSGGAYSFTRLAPGPENVYYLEFALPAGYRPSAQDQGDDTLDSDPGQSTYQTITTTLTAGQNDTSWDFGIFPTASIGDRAWLDLDADGLQEAGETGGVPGVQVVLYDGAGAELNTTVTDVSGAYSFDGLVAGSYALRFVPPASYLLSPQDVGSDDAADSDVSPVTFRTITTTLTAGTSDTRWDIGLYQLPSLGDRVWHDQDGDGAQDAGEPGVPGVPVELYSPGADGAPGGGDDTLVLSTTTTLSGTYRFEDLDPGAYFVQFGAAPGYSLLSPRDSAADDETDSDVDAGRRTPVVNLPASTVDLSLDMGVLNPASLGDYLWFDADVDGIQDAAESGVAGVTVTLFSGEGTTVVTTTTAGDGGYLFANLLPGEYYVIFSDLPAQRSFTRPNQGGDDARDSDAIQSTRYTYDGSGNVTGSQIIGVTGLARLVSGGSDLDLDGGIYETISLGDRVWIDGDADGVQEVGETDGVPGVRVELLRDSDGAVLDYTYTDSDGLYLFSDLFPDTYRVRFGDIPAGYLRSPQGQGADRGADSDADSSFETGAITPASGPDLRYDLGLYQPASIGDRVWEDLDGDGVQDTGEPGIAGVTVGLSGADGAGGLVSLTTTTDVSGTYGFANLAPGVYTVTVTAPAGHVFSARDRGGDDALDSDADAGGQMASTSLTSGESDQTWDAGLYRPASIGNYVWEDLDGDGVQGAGEPGVAGVTVGLSGADGVGGPVSLTTTTDVSGTYGFANLAPGVYTVTVTAPAGYAFTSRDILASEVVTATDANDSDASPATGAMVGTTLVSGESDQSWDAGLYRPASIGDRVWEDLDGDGAQEASEPDFGGVLVTLTGAGRNRAFGTGGDDVVITATTDLSGTYGFAGLQPGPYRLTFARPGGYAFTTGDATGDAADSDVPAGLAATASATTSLDSGEDDPTWDAGLYRLLALGSRVWDDLDNDGLYESPAEAGLDGVGLRLYRDLNGDGDVADAGETAPISTTTTSGGGIYLFNGLEQGDYLVEVTPGAGYVSSTGTNGGAAGPSEPAPDADLDPDDSDDNGTQAGAVVRSATITLAPAAEPTGATESDALPPALASLLRDEDSNLTLDFGLFRPASIGDQVWLDRDADGAQDGGDETGVAGVTVTLFLDDLTPGPSAGDTPVVSATTGATGAYGFGGLATGSYYLAFELPAGYVRSPADATADNSDSDADRATGVTAPTALSPGENDPTWDAGLYQHVNLGDLVWDDRNNNGFYESATEPGLDGVTVNLYRDLNGDGDVADGAETTPISTTTTAGGLYGFAGLDPGSYVVELPAGNFGGAGALAATASLPAYRSSTGANGAPTGPFEGAATPLPDTNTNGDDNGTTDGAGNVRTMAVTLRTQDEPLAGVDGDGTNGNLSLDFGLFRPLSLGDLVWNDQNNNRVIDGGEPGIAGVTVELRNAANTATISTTITSATGAYTFTDLGEGDYLVRIPTSNFTSTGKLRYFRSSDAGSAADPAPDPDDDDNTDDNGGWPLASAVTGDVDSGVITLTVGGEPTGDGDTSANTNLSLDFGFYSLTLGNLVFDDLNNSGLFESATESSVSGATVALLYDADGSGTIGGAETTPVFTTTTAANGRYLIGGLRDGGSYAVQLTLPSNYVSSTGVNGKVSGPFEPAPDPDSPAAADSDDNGSFVSGSLVRTPTFTMTTGAEPVAEPDATLPNGESNPAADNSSDLSVDFGIFDDARLGDLVWLDANGDGIQTGETTYIGGVTVSIYDASTGLPLDGDPLTPGTQPLTTTTTATSSSYGFTRLISGTYYLRFSSIPPQYAVSPRNAAGGTTANNSDVFPVTGETSVISLTNTSNDLTWDMGLYPRLNLGSHVWYDANDNGLRDAGESGIPGVTVELYQDGNANNSYDAGVDTLVVTTTTTITGAYAFGGLEQGAYIAVIPAAEFAGGQELYLHRSSTGSNGNSSGLYEPAPDPDSGLDGAVGGGDDDRDDDDNGSAVGGLVASKAITLNPSAEPTGDGDGANGNLTLDFGFFEPLSLGNLVWDDRDNSGSVGPGEGGIAGVEVQLYLDANGNGAIDDGVPAITTTTGLGGAYAFSDLIEGAYIARIPASQFGAGGPLAGYVSSSGANGGATGPFEGALTPDADLVVQEDDDNGTTDGTGNVNSLPITLARGAEPPAATDGDGTNGNQTLDFGLYRPASIGDRVWHDINADGAQGAGEPGIQGVTVTLYLDNDSTAGPSGGDTVAGSAATGATGLYTFTNLRPAGYYLAFAMPAGYTTVSARDRGDDSLDSDVDPLTRLTPVVALAPGASDPTWDMGVYSAASIGNFVWRDTNGNGVQDAGEPGEPGVAVALDGADGLGNTVSLTTTTDGAGAYGFAGLIPGVYTVTVTAPAGLAFTYPNITALEVSGASDANDSDANPATGVMSTTVLTSGEDDPSWDAGLVASASLGDRVWHDQDADGVQDAGEPGIGGVPVTLAGAGRDGAFGTPDDTAANTSTDGLGGYGFVGLHPGRYRVTFDRPLDYDRFSPADAAGDDGLDSDVPAGAGPSGTTITIDLASGQSDPRWDAGLYRLARLGDLVWEDEDADGAQGLGELGVADVTVTLAGVEGTGAGVSLSTTTDATGVYSFTGLVPGVYTVTVTAPAGYRLTAMDRGDNALDSDADPISGVMASTVLTASESDLSWDAGLFRPAAIGDRVWRDTDGNGAQDTGEPGVAGVAVALAGVDGAGNTVSLSTTTDATGLYGFAGLVPGVYTVTVTAPAGDTFTVAAAAADTDDSDADPASGVMESTTLATGESDQTWDAGLFGSASIGDFVWEDMDGDGQQDSGEPGVEGVSLALAGVDGAGNTVSLSTTTDASGAYSFDGLAPGTYTVTVSAPAGYLITARNWPGDDALDSDADPATGVMSATVLASGEDDPSWDAGLYRPASIGDLVWHDADADGAQDAGEAGLQSVKVGLSGVDGTGAGVSLSTATDASGAYGFAGLVPGVYTVTVTAPGGYAMSPRDAGDDTRDSDADEASGVMASTVITSGESDLSWDAGLFQPVSLGDLVFEDFADDGSFTAGTDQPIAGAEVGLYGADGLSPVNDLSGTLVPSRTTGADGLYLFANLRPGAYVVRVAAPAGYQSSTDLDSTPNADGDLNGDDNGIGQGGAVASSVVTLTSRGEPIDDGDTDATSNLGLDFGFFRPAAIGDYVWLDADRDGAQGAGEGGVPGVTVELWRDGGATAAMTATTGAGGDYRFDRLPTGAYYVRFVLPPDFDYSPADAADDTLDSDADEATGATAVTTLDPGEEDLTWDAGVFYAAGLGNRVWLDRDADGVQGPGEPGLAGVTVTLLDGTGAISATDTTDAGGFYGFAHLPPGTYQISFTVPAGYLLSPPDRDSRPDADSDADAAGLTELITLAPGAYDPTWDAGLYQLVGLGDLVWEDTNNNGAVDGGEGGLAGVPVSLFADADADGAPDTSAPLATTATGADGGYRFDGLRPGRYLVEIAPPAGYRTSTGTPGAAVGPAEPAPGPDDDHEGDDNGTAAGARVRSGTVTLWSQFEPGAAVDGDDTNGNMSVDFGLFQPASLGSTVWYDRDGDGRQGPGEPGVPGVTVTLYHGDGTPARDAAGRPIVATTDTSGKYLFTNLSPGSYLVGFTNLPAGYTFTVPGVGDDDGDSDASPITGLTVAVTLRPGDQNLSLWAGLINPTAVSLTRFTAERRGAGVDLRWETGAEWETWGFHILRSADGTRAGALRVTPALIAARGGPQLGAAYAWHDADAPAGATYWLEEVELDGETREYGPITPRSSPGDLEPRVFLPLVIR